jgi:hypothetical protein
LDATAAQIGKAPRDLRPALRWNVNVDEKVNVANPSCLSARN